ncbi:MAG: ADOP family duplicated permease [Gemmatimonadaceae bacterium]
MAWYHHLTSAIQSQLRRRHADRELAEEMRHHVDLEAEWNMRQGLSPEAARQRALRSFGGMERYADEVRDERGARFLETLRQDLRFAWRSLRRRAGFTSLVVLTLAFGIGATATLFAVVRSVLLTPLPYGRTEGIAVLWSAWKGFPKTWLSYDEYEAWDADIPAISDVGLYTDGAANLTGGDQPERVRAASVGANVFSVLGVAPMLGRGFSAEEDRPNGARAAILSYEAWQRRHGGDLSVVGRSIQVNGEAVPMIGVMPPGFKLPGDFTAAGPTDLYFPLATDAASQGVPPGPTFNQGGGNHGFLAVARLAPNADVHVVNTQLTEYVARLVRENVFSREFQFRAFAVSIEDEITGSVRGPLLVLLGAVGIVLLIACANVAGLLLVRGERRRRELAVRVALGAEGPRLTRLLFAESAMLASLGAVAGCALTWGGIVILRRAAPDTLPRVGETHIEPALLVFVLLIASLVALLTGVLPAVQATRVAPSDELKEGGKSATAGGARLKWRQALVTAEIALAVLLVIGAGLMVRSVANLLAIDPGFNPRGVLTMRLSTPSAWYPDSVRVAAFWEGLQTKVAQLPQVQSVGAVLLLPLATEMGDWGLQVEGYTPPPNTGTPGDWQVVTPGYFETFGLRLASGRFFDARDDINGPLAMIVNKRFTELYLAGRPPLGTRVRIGGSPDSVSYTIVGVVDNVKHNALTREVKAQFYAPLAQFARAPGNTMRSMSLAVKTNADPRSLIAPVRSIIRAIDARLPVADVRTLEDVVGASIAAPRFAMQLLAAFGIIALTLSAIGVFGVVSQVVAMREQEFGIRAALGARPIELVRLSLATGLRQTLAGLAIGVVGALAATRLLGRLLEGVKPTDPLTFAAVVVVTAAVALLASALPARRAAKAQPGSVLRSD